MGQQKNRGIIGILTGGGDVPGLNPAIRAVTIRALREGYKVIGIKRGWGGLIDIVRDPQYDNSGNFFELTEEIVNKAGRTGGTFLHTSRTRASHVPKANVPKHLQDRYSNDINDLTPEVLKNLEFMGIDYLIPIGGDDTLSYAVRLSKESVKVVAIPKPWTTTFPEQITVSGSAPASPVRLPSRMISGHQPDLTNEYWFWKSSDVMQGSRLCYQP